MSRNWPRILLSPLVLLGALLCAVGLVVLLLVPSPSAPELVQVEEVLAEPERQSEQVQLVSFLPGPGETWLAQPSFVNVQVSEIPSERYAAILAALRELLEGSLWPEGLSLPAVIVAGDSADDETVVLDFALEAPVPVSVTEEERLLLALRTTLERNGAEAVRILVNHEPSASFLGHVVLEGSLE